MPYTALKSQLIPPTFEEDEPSIFDNDLRGDRTPSGTLKVIQRRDSQKILHEVHKRTLLYKHLSPELQAALHPFRLLPVAEQAIMTDGIEIKLNKRITRPVPRQAVVYSTPSRHVQRSEIALQKPHTSARTVSDAICFYHRKFGQRAKRCEPPCNFHRPRRVNTTSEHGKQLYFIKDKILGKDFLVDTGAEPIESLGLRSWDDIRRVADPLPMMQRIERDIENMQSGFGGRLNHEDSSLAGSYETDENGNVRFVTRFTAIGFDPADITVNSTDKQLSVHAKKVIDDGSSKCTREFCRVISLPEHIDSKELKCHLTEDGVLSVEAPVSRNEARPLMLCEGGNLAVQPWTEERVKQLPDANVFSVRGVSGPSVYEDEQTGRRLHLEVPIDPSYGAADLRVIASSRQINIRGRRKCESGLLAECSNSYGLPEVVNPLSVRAAVIGNTLVVDAPLPRQHKIEMKK